MGIAANIRVEKNGKRMDVIGEFYDKPPVFVVPPSNVYGIHGTDDGYMLIHTPNRQTILDDKDCIAWFVTRSLSIAAELSFDFDGDYAEITQEDFLHDISEQKQRLEKFHPKVLGCDSINREFDRDEFTEIFLDFIMHSDAVYDYVEYIMETGGFVGDFHIWKNHEEEVFFCHMPSGTIVSWYKWNHIGRSNWMNRLGTYSDLEAFFKMLRLDVIDEIKDKPEYFEKPDMFRQHKKMTEEEIKEAMEKLNKNAIYGMATPTVSDISTESNVDVQSAYPKTIYEFASSALEHICGYFNKLDSNILIKRNDDEAFLRIYKVNDHRIEVRKEGAFVSVHDRTTGEMLIFAEFITRYINSSESLIIKFSALEKSTPIVSDILREFLLNIYDALYDVT